MPPAAKDFWLPLFIYPITPPATKFKGKTISSYFFLAPWKEQPALKFLTLQDIVRLRHNKAVKYYNPKQISKYWIGGAKLFQKSVHSVSSTNTINTEKGKPSIKGT